MAPLNEFALLGEEGVASHMYESKRCSLLSELLFLKPPGTHISLHFYSQDIVDSALSAVIQIAEAPRALWGSAGGTVPHPLCMKLGPARVRIAMNY